MMVLSLFIIGHMGLFFYNKIGSIISIVDLPTTNIIEPKKDQINERVEKLGKLKPITINYNGKSEVIDSKEKLQELMNKAVKDEVAQI
ncbi:TPA: ZmpA/ZmpB/ZmpC family metallo-endopeptidase [Streptococcus pneumoniae]